MTSDRDLLEKFARENSQDAFAEIVRRHLNLVYSAALRQIRSPQLAEEIAQSVFADLAHNAGKIRSAGVSTADSLTPWLYGVTRRTAIDVIRKESRRQLREQIAVEMNKMNATANDWTQIEPLLDDAVAALDETDRSAVLLRYFENKSLREVGEALGASEDAAQKRVSRAVERLREFFSKRKVTIGASGLAVLISANAVQSAPVGLVVTISAAAVLAGTAVPTSTAITAAKVIAMTTLQKTLITASVAVLAGAGIYEAHQAVQLRDQVHTLQQQQAPLTEQIQELQRERNNATNRLAGLQAENEQLKANQNEAELLKLRGEVARSRAMSQEFARLKDIEQAAELGTDEGAWLERVRLLKQRMAETPEAQIPELKYLTDDDWLRTAKHKLENEADYRNALMSLDANAQSDFLRLMETALRKFLDANQGQFPTDTSQLKSYLTNSADADLLQRYQIQQAKKIAGGSQMAGNPDDYVITPVQTFGGGQWFLNREGVGGISKEAGNVMDILAPALKAMADATPTINGRKEMSIRNLGPFLTTPEQKAAYQRLIGGIDQK